MSECLTLDVFAAEEKFSEEQSVTIKVIVQSLLNETLHSAINDLEREENTQPEVKPKKYKLICERNLLDSELRIQNEINEITNSINGKSYKTTELLPVDQSANEKIHFETPEEICAVGSQEHALADRSFIPFTAEDSRQVWKCDNSSRLKNCDGDLIDQTQVLRIIKKLSGLEEMTGSVSVPTVLTIEEDFAKMCEEVEERRTNVSTQDMDEAIVLHDPDELDDYESAGARPPQETSVPNPKRITEDSSSLICNDDVERKVNKSCSFSNCLKLKGIPAATESVELKPDEFSDDIRLNPRASIDQTQSINSFVESSESVIQIINPQESSDEESEEEVKGITFSIFREGDTMDCNRFEEGIVQHHKNEPVNPERFEEKQYVNIYSGMTTVGPMKNLHYNPKTLAGPEIDFGKMTRIDDSQVIKIETGRSFSSASKEIYVANHKDNKITPSESSYVEPDTIVNHDIASLTKVQKVKEVLSDQPKSNENLGDEEKLMRPFLDLKDVDADSSDSYNVIDSNLPLMSMEETDPNNCKQFENVQVIVNGTIYRIPRETSEIESQMFIETVGKLSNRNLNIEENNFMSCDSQLPIENNIGKNKHHNEKRIRDSNPNEKNSEKGLSPGKTDEHPPVSSSFNHNKSFTQLSASQSQKHSLSRVFQKASNKFITKDSDSCLRNSKSLPRDTNKLSNTDSFKSLLDDCQTSAASVLKKSRSLLRNTQNIFKAVSKTGFNHVVSGDKQVFTSDMVVRTHSRQSLSSKKNEFSKLKEVLKCKVSETLKSMENITSADNREKSSDQKELKSIKQSETKERVDQTENTKKPPPKSPLVCANQFFHNQLVEVKKVNYDGSVTKLGRWLTCKDGLPETLEILDQAPENSESFASAVTPSQIENREGIPEVNVSEKEIEVLYGVNFPEKCRFIGSKPPGNDEVNEIHENSKYANHIVLENIHDVCEPQILKNETSNRILGKLTETKDNPEGFFKTPEKTLLKNSSDNSNTFTLPIDCTIQDKKFDDFVANEGKEVQNSLSNVKLRRKNKKLSTRIRRFWQSAFGKVKTSQKKDVS